MRSYQMKTTVKRRKIRVIIGVYLGAWLLTQVVGATQIRWQVLRPYLSAGSARCLAVAYAPFLVRVDYGFYSGPLSGGGGGDLYIWLLGFNFHIHKFYRELV